MRCDSCGFEKESAKLTVDPFQLAVWKQRVLRYLCDHCFERRLAQI